MSKALFARLAAIAGAVALAAATLFAAPPSGAQPQPASGPPNALQGFSQNRDQPIKIDAASLEVRDKEKKAIFAGNVQLVQGDTVLKCKKLVVFYDQDAKADGKAAGPDGKPAAAGAKPDAVAKPDGKTATSGAKPPPQAGASVGGGQSVRRIEAQGDVVVTQKDQKASADTAVMDTKTNQITLFGNVVISQGQNVVRGDRLSVDLTTSVSRMECDKSSQCRVQALLQPSAKDGANPASAPDPAVARDAAKPRLSNPSGL